MYMSRIDGIGMSMLASLEDAGYAPRSPVEKLKRWERYNHYRNIYEAVHRDGSRSFVKSSTQISNPFTFDDKETAAKHMDVYKALTGEKLYDSRSFFALEKNGKGYGVVASMPAVTLVSGKNRTGLLAERFNEKWSTIFSRWPLGFFHEDVAHEFNYGLAEDGEFYYFDLNLFESIPSPLAEDPRVKKSVTSA